MELELDVSRNAVARIRVKDQPPGPGTLTRQELNVLNRRTRKKAIYRDL
ncbi:hypothetical protein [Desulfonatronospira sp.]|nr:hypothetical protein [Desulfonatronospira sp.]